MTETPTTLAQALMRPVPDWALLHAVRWGIAQRTLHYAPTLQLIRDFWPRLRHWRHEIETDLRLVAGDDQARELLAWIQEQERT